MDRAALDTSPGKFPNFSKTDSRKKIIKAIQILSIESRKPNKKRIYENILD
jgi:hypothetical protein